MTNLLERINNCPFETKKENNDTDLNFEMSSLDVYDIIEDLVETTEKTNLCIAQFYDFDEDYKKVRKIFFEILKERLLKNERNYS